MAVVRLHSWNVKKNETLPLHNIYSPHVHVGMTDRFHSGDTPELRRQNGVNGSQHQQSQDALKPIYNYSQVSDTSNLSALSDSDMSISNLPSPDISKINLIDDNVSLGSDKLQEPSHGYDIRPESSHHHSQHNHHPSYESDPQSSLNVPPRLRKSLQSSDHTQHSRSDHSRHSKGLGRYYPAPTSSSTNSTDTEESLKRRKKFEQSGHQNELTREPAFSTPPLNTLDSLNESGYGTVSDHTDTETGSLRSRHPPCDLPISPKIPAKTKSQSMSREAANLLMPSSAPIRRTGSTSSHGSQTSCHSAASHTSVASNGSVVTETLC